MRYRIVPCESDGLVSNRPRDQSHTSRIYRFFKFVIFNFSRRNSLDLRSDNLIPPITTITIKDTITKKLLIFPKNQNDMTHTKKNKH